MDGPVEDECRARCCEEAVLALKPGGMIVVDNSNRLPMSCALLQKAGFTEVDFAGFLPLGHFTNCTSLFFKGPFCFERLPAPLTIIGGPGNPWEPWSEFEGATPSTGFARFVAAMRVG